MTSPGRPVLIFLAKCAVVYVFINLILWSFTPTMTLARSTKVGAGFVGAYVFLRALGRLADYYKRRKKAAATPPPSAPPPPADEGPADPSSDATA